MEPQAETPTFEKPGAVPVEPAGAAILPKTGGDLTGLPHELWEARVAVVAALRTEGYTLKQIAAAMKMGRHSVAWCLRQARARGALQDGVKEAINLLDNEAVPLAVDALMRKLHKGEDRAVFGVLEGRGLLRNFTQVKSEGDAGKTNMAFQFVFTGGPAQGEVTATALPQGLPGQVVGNPRGDE